MTPTDKPPENDLSQSVDADDPGILSHRYVFDKDGNLVRIDERRITARGVPTIKPLKPR